MTAAACSRSLAPFALLLSLCAAQDQPKFTTRVYDVRDIVQREAMYRPATAIEASFVPNDRERSNDLLCALELSDAVDTIMSATSPEYWCNEGVELRPEESGFVTATCGAKMHRQIDQALADIRAMLFETVLVEVHELPGAALEGRPSVLTPAMADGLLAQIGEHPVHFGRTSVRRALLLESKRTQNRIAGLGASVSQGAAAHRPMVATDAYGSSWSVVAMRTMNEGLLVSVTGSDRALDGKAVGKRVSTGESQNGAELELAPTSIATCHSSAYLKPGQSMLVGTNASDGTVLCVRVRRAGAPTSSKIGQLGVFPIASLVAGPRPATDVVLPGRDSTLFPEVEEERIPTMCDQGRLIEAITSQIEPDSWDGSPNTLHATGGYLFVYTPMAGTVAGEVAAMLRKLQEFDARQYSLEVRFGVAGADALRLRPEQLADKLPQRCLSTVSASRETQISATRHTPYVRDYDTVMASESSALHPQLGSFAEGFLMRGRIANSGQGSVRLDLHLTTLARGAAGKPFEFGHPRIGAIDRVDVRENKVRGVASVELSQWTLLHVSPVEGGAGHVAVVVRVSPIQ